jgi:outer membrane protein TolC
VALRMLGSVVVFMPILGCETAVLLDPPQEGSEVSVLEASNEEARLPAEPTAPRRPSFQISLVAGSRLAYIAERLDQVAITRSSALPEEQAARAQLRALQFERYPQIRPTASAPLTGGSASFGLNIEQLIWGAGRIRGRMTDAELKVAEASLRAWEERNSIIYDGLEAYVNITRYEARLRSLASLKSELDAISALLQTRMEGGVADRGELLRMNAAINSVERRSVNDRSDLRQAQTDFSRLMADTQNTGSLSSLRSATSQCSRSWPDSETPADALARVSLSRTQVSEDIVRAQRFPRVVLSGGTTYSQEGWSKPAIGIQLDASDMLGLGRKSTVDAASASTRAAEAFYTLQKDETQADLARMEANFGDLRADITLLRALAQQGEATLDLYEEQLDVGTISLTDGIVFHRERVDTLIFLIDAEADILLNCFRSSQQRGLLAPFGAIDESN